MTDRRALVVDTLERYSVEDEVLWQAGRSSIRAVSVQKYSHAQHDVKLVFTDGSWCRLNVSDPRAFCRHLAYVSKVVDPGALTQGQRRKVADFVAEVGKGSAVVTRRRSGNYLIEVRDTEDVRSQGISVRSEHMGADGEIVKQQPGDR